MGMWFDLSSCFPFLRQPPRLSSQGADSQALPLVAGNGMARLSCEPSKETVFCLLSFLCGWLKTPPVMLH